MLLISLSSCKTAGSPSGKLPTDEIYVQAGEDKVTVGELWNELKWSSSTVLTSKIEEAVTKEYYNKVSLIMDKSYSSLTDDEKKLFGDDFTVENFNELYSSYESRLQDYVIEDVYNFTFSVTDDYSDIVDVSKYDAQKLIRKYSEEMYTKYNKDEINGKTLEALCEEAAKDEEKRENYTLIAKEFKTLYYQSLAKELLTYDKHEENIQEAYDNRDKDNEDDLGYFSKSDYTSKFKSKFANQGDLNVLLIRFTSTAEFNSTLRSFGIKEYNDNWYYIPSEEGLPVDGEGGTSFSDYCKYYDDLTTSDIKGLDGNLAAQELTVYDVALIYIQIYNYLYGGYRDILYDDQYVSQFNSVDLRGITEQIRRNTQEIIQKDGYDALKTHFNDLVKALENQRDDEGIDTFYTRKEIDAIQSTLNRYLYDTLSLPFEDNDLCYSLTVQSYNNSNWIAFKFSEEEDAYSSIYNKDTIDDDLFDSIEADKDLKAAIEKELKEDLITSTAISNAVSERTDEVVVKIYDEALEISYSITNSDYSKTYGKAPNDNVIATIKYKDKTYNLNILEDTDDENALIGGVYNILEQENGITTAIDILSKKVVKRTKAYEKTAENIDTYKKQLEYALAAFSNNYYSTSGYPASIG
ncbi:MAG: hypothetical protein K2O05_01835, partial [Anaeroplasmataceae bacterium]|nr:hypothetical protein [Anaeroplasmataceae bacterium]